MPDAETEADEESQPSASTSKLSKFARNGTKSDKGKKGKAANGSVKYTPLEQQVLELKAKHPDVFLLFEVGYKFIAYEEDAVNASKELNIACFPKNVNSRCAPHGLKQQSDPHAPLRRTYASQAYLSIGYTSTPAV